MPTLQIRNLPSDVYEILSFRAEREGRSLAQQAIVDLRKLPELEARQRRLELIDRLRKKFRQRDPRQVSALPEQLIREDRDLPPP